MQLAACDQAVRTVSASFQALKSSIDVPMIEDARDLAGGLHVTRRGNSKAGEESNSTGRWLVLRHKKQCILYMCTYIIYIYTYTSMCIYIYIAAVLMERQTTHRLHTQDQFICLVLIRESFPTAHVPQYCASDSWLPAFWEQSRTDSVHIDWRKLWKPAYPTFTGYLISTRAHFVIFVLINSGHGKVTLSVSSLCFAHLERPQVSLDSWLPKSGCVFGAQAKMQRFLRRREECKMIQA